MTKSISVYADWEPLHNPSLLGTLYAHAGGGKEIFEFGFDPDAISNQQIASVSLDPRLGFYAGRQHPLHGQTFGLFADASPDRWGRLLMKRRLERDQRAGIEDPKRRLVESDYLLGVHDEFRVGVFDSRLEMMAIFSITDRTWPRRRLYSYVSWRLQLQR